MEKDSSVTNSDMNLNDQAEANHVPASNPSFFQSSCTGKLTFGSIQEGESSKGMMQPELEGGVLPSRPKNHQSDVKSKIVGGYTCAVPYCSSNTKKNKELFFYRFPNGESKEKIKLRKRWINLISRKDFTPSDSHRVCSLHFLGGKKTYMNNVPMLVPKATRPRIPIPRPTVKSRNRSQLCSQNILSDVDNLNVQENIGGEVNFANLHEPSQETKLAKEINLMTLQINDMKTNHQAELVVLKAKIISQNEEIAKLKSQLEQASFAAANFKNDKQLFQFYTGLPDYDTFILLFKSFGDVVNKLIYHNSNTNEAKTVSSDAKKRGPKRKLSAEQEFFLVLARLRCGLLERDLAHRAGISLAHISRICITWFDFLSARFRSIPIWPSREVVDGTMPSSFKKLYKQTRVIVDATELFIEMPSSLRSQSQTYSNYKHHNTAKGLIGIAPSGAVTFVSDLYSGRSSDKAITKDCGMLNLLEKGDSVMADKGFNIEEDLPAETTLNIPPFLGANAQFSLEEETETRRVASVRVHVERAIRRIKVFRLLKTTFPLSMAPELNKIWIICSYLSNFLPPLILEKDETEQ